MIEPISAAYLLAFGILLIGLEALTFTFVIFFIGIGFILISFISFFYAFTDGSIQLAAAFVLALILAFVLRKTLMNKMSKASTKPEERAHVSGIGFVESGMVKFDGTYWKTLDDLSAYKEGDKVEIINVVDNMVVLKQ